MTATSLLHRLSSGAPVILLGLMACAPPRDNTTPSTPDSGQMEEIDIGRLQEGYKNGAYTIEGVTAYYLERIEAIDKKGPGLNSIICINPDALSIARQLDEELKQGKSRGPMHGVPIILKDNIDTHDSMPTTAGARALAKSFPLQDSWVTRRLREAGAVILGKSNLSEWANFHSNFSSSGWSGLGGQTKNPYDPSRNPCGSSAGSGVAVSANLCVIAIGTETNGSIVCPANNNGIVGIKPTVGLISRAGIIPISATCDTPGPMTRTVRDAAITLSILAGIDTADAQTRRSGDNLYPIDYTRYLSKDGLKGKRIGWFTGPSGKHHRVDTLMKAAIAYLKQQGATVIEIDKIQLNDDNSSFEVLLYEFKDGLNKYFQSLGAKAPVKSLEDLIAQTAADTAETKYFDHALLTKAQAKGNLESPEYKTALQTMLRNAREDGIDRVMKLHQLDAIVAPTGGPAWETDLVNGDRFMIGSSSPAARAGYPNITVPMGYVDGLPVGISFFGRAWSEGELIGMAFAYEQGTLWRKAPGLKDR
jgi:amidase